MLFLARFVLVFWLHLAIALLQAFTRKGFGWGLDFGLSEVAWSLCCGGLLGSGAGSQR